MIGLKNKTIMKISTKIRTLLLVLASIMTLSSCNHRGDYNPLSLVTALVTYEDLESGVQLQLDDNTSLKPSNLQPGLYNHKTVRALVRYVVDAEDNSSENNVVKVIAVDTIRTKAPSEDMGDQNDVLYGNDKLEIINEWVTIAEDGYLTLMVRTHRGNSTARHSVFLVRKGGKDGQYDFELRHDADGDIYGIESDGLIAFDLNDLAPEDRSPVTLHLTWDGFYETRNVDFKLTFRKQ